MGMGVTTTKVREREGGKKNELYAGLWALELATYQLCSVLDLRVQLLRQAEDHRVLTPLPP